MKEVLIASDHAGFELKEKLKSSLSSEYTIVDLGPSDESRVDYPDFADKVAEKINSKQTEFGILVCGSGQGMAIRANRYPYVRAALCYSEEIARLSREHNDANVLCIGGRVTDHSIALSMARIFLETKFDGGRHELRVEKLKAPIAK